MSAQTQANFRPLDLSRFRMLPLILMVVGAVGIVVGAIIDTRQFMFSWLLAYMFFLSLCLGSLFLVLVHHLFDASWSVPLRRFLEHGAYLLPAMTLLWIPIGIFAPQIYPWMQMDPHSSHALEAKLPLFTKAGFYIVAVICFVVWWVLSSRLRSLSLQQDKDGSPQWTYKLRKTAAIGIFLFAVTTTLAAIMWMKALQHHWFSTMYGVYYFAASVWTTLGTAYMIAAILQRTGHLRDVVHPDTYYFIGTLFFAFTVFYAYVTFSQYFIIWNANIPEETFWYVLREQGSWYGVSMVIIFGHFFVPFLTLLRIDAKMALWVMVPIGIWAWLMHYIDLSFNIMPVLHPEGYMPNWQNFVLDISCLAFFAGVLLTIFLKLFAGHAAYPIKDPRLAESLGMIEVPDEYVKAAGGRAGGDR